MKYSIILEPTRTGFSGFSPDIDGCIATGKTEEETRKNLQEAIELHFEGLKFKTIPLSKRKQNKNFIS